MINKFRFLPQEVIFTRILCILVILIAAASCSFNTAPETLTTNDWQWDPLLNSNFVTSKMRAWTYSTATGYVLVGAPLKLTQDILEMDGQVIFPAPSLSGSQALRAWEGQIWIDYLVDGEVRQLYLYDYTVKNSSDFDVEYASQLILKVDTSPSNNLGTVDGHSATAAGCILFMAESFSGYAYIMGPQPGYCLNGLNIALPLPSGAIGGAVLSVAVDADGVSYAVGTSSNMGSSTATYWIDGDLADPPEGTTPRAVIKTGGGIYLVCADRYYGTDGMERTDLSCASGRYSDPQSYTSNHVESIFIESEGTVYLLGGTIAVGDLNDRKPCYWMNGARTDLPYDGYDSAWATFIGVGAGHIVSVGKARSGEVKTPVCWLDATIYPIELPENATCDLSSAGIDTGGSAIVQGTLFLNDGSSRRATWVNGVLQS